MKKIIGIKNYIKLQSVLISSAMVVSTTPTIFADTNSSDALFRTKSSIDAFQVGLNWFMGIDMGIGILLAMMVYMKLAKDTGTGMQSGNSSLVQQSAKNQVNLFINTAILTAALAIVAMIAKAFLWMLPQ